MSFGKYAEYYDLLYEDKDYSGECDFIEAAIRRYALRPVHSLLDLGCGTGGHAIVLAGRGYNVSGVDLSEGMLERARAKADVEGTHVDFHTADIRRFALKNRFDACVCMFAALGYLPGNEDIRQGLAAVHNHLCEGGLFVFDCWNGLAVMHTMPSVRVKDVANGDRRIMRVATPQLDAVNHVCRVHYRLIARVGDRVVDEIEEIHQMRFFFPQELVHYLEDAGFEILKMSPFPQLDGQVSEETWNLAVIARAGRLDK